MQVRDPAGGDLIMLCRGWQGPCMCAPLCVCVLVCGVALASVHSDPLVDVPAPAGKDVCRLATTSSHSLHRGRHRIMALSAQ